MVVEVDSGPETLCRITWPAPQKKKVFFFYFLGFITNPLFDYPTLAKPSHQPLSYFDLPF